MFWAIQCPSSGARQTAVAASGFRMNVEVEVFLAVVGLLTNRLRLRTLPVSVQGNKFYEWLLHLVGCFIRVIFISVSIFKNVPYTTLPQNQCTKNLNNLLSYNSALHFVNYISPNTLKNGYIRNIYLNIKLVIIRLRILYNHWCSITSGAQ